MAIFSKQRLDDLRNSPQVQANAATRPLVMIVDDEEGNRSVMRTLLEDRYELLIACDGREALELVQRMPAPEQLSCIVSDHRMPNLTGIELFRELEQLLPRASRIIVTGFVDIETIIDSINKARIYQFIVKPFDANDFVLTVRRAVESFELQRQLSAYQLELEQKVEQRTRELMAANRELQASADQILALYNNASCGYHSIDRDGVFVHVNDTELSWLGRARDDVAGKLKFADVLTPASLAALLEKFPRIASDGWLTGLTDVEVEFQRPDGRTVPVLLNATTITQAADGDASMAALARYTVFDITRRKRREEEVQHKANHDVLTGLPNRALMQQRAEQALDDAARNGSCMALVFIDLDKFKQINDQLGHQVGDRLLVAAAQRLRRCVRSSDTVARLGGDEFVLLLPALSDQAPVHTIAAKVVQSLGQPFHIDGQSLEISASAGISIYPDHGLALEKLIELADAAMYRAKTGGRNHYVFHGDLL
jgi:diguanylate cyclase (GGDEF)-like protein/PAS domain S-box-containing protein